MKQIAERKITTNIVREYSSVGHVDDLGKHESTMTLYQGEEKPRRFILEWDIPDLDETVEIGLWADEHKNLLDYDGIFSLPAEAIQFLRDEGFIVGPDFE